MNDKTVRAIIEGRVRGVGFRYATHEKAAALRLTGWVKNESNGTVSALLQGTDSTLSDMIEWLHVGPPFSEVTRVDIQVEKAHPIVEDFSIRY